jgi:hypothetical protein
MATELTFQSKSLDKGPINLEEDKTDATKLF